MTRHELKLAYGVARRLNRVLTGELAHDDTVARCLPAVKTLAPETWLRGVQIATNRDEHMHTLHRIRAGRGYEGVVQLRLTYLRNRPQTACWRHGMGLRRLDMIRAAILADAAQAERRLAHFEWTGPVRLEGSWGTRELAEATRLTLTIWRTDSPDWLIAELDYPDGEMTEQIGLYLSDDRTELVDYDGVMSLPPQLIPMLEGLGIKVGEDFRDD